MPESIIVHVHVSRSNISCTTFYRAIRECEEGIPCNTSSKNGWPRIFTELRAIESAREKIGVSTRHLVRVSHITVEEEKSQNTQLHNRNGFNFIAQH